jgi:hypothetical protein
MSEGKRDEMLNLEERKIRLEERKLELQVKLFEVDQLRKEILQHDALNTQVANWTAAGSLACAGYAWSQGTMHAYGYALVLVGVAVAWVGLLNNLVRSQANVYIGSYIAKNLEPNTGLTWESHLRHDRANAGKRPFGHIGEDGPRAFAVTFFYVGSVVHAYVWASKLGYSAVPIVAIGLLGLVIPWFWNIRQMAKHVRDVTPVKDEEALRNKGKANAESNQVRTSAFRELPSAALVRAPIRQEPSRARRRP